MEFLTVEEVATACRVSTQTVLNWIHAGRLPAVRLSARVIRIPRAAFERLRTREQQRPDGHADSAAQSIAPSAAVELRPWQAVLAEYEQHFAMSTREMLALQAAGSTPALRTADDERLYEAWQGAARLASAAGLLDPATSEAPVA